MSFRLPTLSNLVPQVQRDILKFLKEMLVRKIIVMLLDCKCLPLKSRSNYDIKMRTPLGPVKSVMIREVSLFQGVQYNLNSNAYSHYVYDTCVYALELRFHYIFAQYLTILTTRVLKNTHSMCLLVPATYCTFNRSCLFWSKIVTCLEAARNGGSSFTLGAK